MIHCAIYTRPQADRRLCDAMRAKGIEAWCPIKMEPGKSRGKSRAPEIHERVIIPRVVFAALSQRQYHDTLASREGRDMLARLDIPPREWPSVERWVQDAEDEAALVLARIAAGEQVEHYRAGDELTVIGGPLDGQLVRFIETVQGLDDLTIRIRARVGMLGGAVPVVLDPLAVKRTV